MAQDVIDTWLGKSALEEEAFLLQLRPHKADSTKAPFSLPLKYNGKLILYNLEKPLTILALLAPWSCPSIL